jgi:glycosidase
VLDMPLNHTSPVHIWTANSNWYRLNENGEKLAPKGTQWNDVVQLNHDNPMLAQACADVLQFWVTVGIDGFRFDAASFIPDVVLENWISSLHRSFQKELLFWCDSESYSRNRPMFNGFLFHEAFYAAKQDQSKWNPLLQSNLTSAIFYLTNHDTLHACKSPIDEWPIDYQRMRKELECSPHHVMLSWSDWQDPSSSYSFML